MRTCTNQGVIVRPAGQADVVALAALAAATYASAFGHSFTPEDLAAHLAQHLSAAQVAEYVTADVVLVAETGGGLVGYVQFGAAGAAFAPRDVRDQEVRRLYVLGEFQGQGIGARLLRAALDHPQVQAAPAVYLDVWEHNPGAIRFYMRHDFQVIGSRSFAVASGAETSRDLIMVCESQ